MKRPVFLTIWLSLMTIAAVLAVSAYIFLYKDIATATPDVPEWVSNLTLITTILQLVAVVLLWMWKKIGFFIEIAAVILATSVAGLLNGPAGVMKTIWTIVFLGILYLAMKPVWKNFK